MEFTAVIPVMKMETRTYNVDVSENTKKVIKAYEKWYDNTSKENEITLIDTIKTIDPSFDEKVDDFGEYVYNVIDDIRWKIYRKEADSGNEGVYEFDDVQGLADGNFNFV